MLRPGLAPNLRWDTPLVQPPAVGVVDPPEFGPGNRLENICVLQAKRAVRRMILAPGIRPALEWARRGSGTILMMSRLSQPDRGVVGHDPARLERTLAFLRSRRYELVELREMFRRLRDGASGADLGVAFTLDDGYADQVEVAAPIFAEYDCPATYFLPTAFLDGSTWLWWDQVEFVLAHATRPRLSTTLGEQALVLELGSARERIRAFRDFTARCKAIPERETRRAIADLAVAAEVELPDEPPARYAPARWSDVRTWESKGMSFAPHTLTHPILSRLPAEASHREIVGSWRRLQEMTRRPCPVFCYPNGQPDDFGPRELATLVELGLDGAITAEAGPAEVADFRSGPEGPFTVPHFAYGDDYTITAQYVSGVERLLHGSGR